MTVNVATNRYGVAQLIVAPTLAEGANYTTIASALTAASSGQTIFIRPGTYTENLTLKAGVNLTAFSCDGFTPNVTIVGLATFTAAGTVGISGIRLQTNSNFFLAVTGSAASIVNLENCYLNATNNTGISFTTSSSSAQINILNCLGNIGTTGIGLYSSSSAGQLQIFYSYITNTGATVTASSNSAGSVQFLWSSVLYPLSTSSTGVLNLEYCDVNTSGTNTTSITTAGTGSCGVVGCGISSGTASAISIGSGTTCSVSINSTIGSSNTNAITGAGTLSYAPITFSSSSNTVNTTTQTPLQVGPIKLNNKQTRFLAYLSANSAAATGDGTVYTVICDTEVYDIGGGYNNATGVFTAPYAGTYLFHQIIFSGSYGAAHTAYGARFNLSTSSLDPTVFTCNPSATTGNTTLTTNGWFQMDMAAGDTCSISFFASGGAKTVVAGGGNIATVGAVACVFSGYLLG